MTSSRFTAAKEYIAEMWQELALGAAGLLVAVGLYVFRLASITHGKTSYPEQLTLMFGNSWKAIYNHPLDAPYYVTVRLLQFIDHSLSSLRFASVIWTILAIGLFFTVVRKLHGIQIAFFGTVLFTTAPWMLHIGRFAASDIMVAFSSLLLLYLFLRRKAVVSAKADSPAVPIWLLAVLIGSCLYIPAMLLPTIVSLIVRFDIITHSWRSSNKKSRSIAITVGLLYAVPLIMAAVREHISFFTRWSGAPSHIPTLHQIYENFIHVPSYLFWRGPENPLIWLNPLPLIGISTAVLAVVGLVYYIPRFKHTNLMLILPLVAWLGISFGIGRLITLIVAFVYLFAAGGVAYLLKVWQRVLPRNPIARGIALIFVIAIIAMLAVYNVRQYFVAWAYSESTRDAYQQKL